MTKVAFLLFSACFLCSTLYSKDITSKDGVVYKDMIVTDYWPNDGVVILHADGIVLLQFSDLNDVDVDSLIKECENKNFCRDISDKKGNEYKSAMIAKVENGNIQICGANGLSWVKEKDIPEYLKNSEKYRRIKLGEKTEINNIANIRDEIKSGGKRRKGVNEKVATKTDDLDAIEEAKKKYLEKTQKKHLEIVKENINDYETLLNEIIDDIEEYADASQRSVRRSQYEKKLSKFINMSRSLQKHMLKSGLSIVEEEKINFPKYAILINNCIKDIRKRNKGKEIITPYTKREKKGQFAKYENDLIITDYRDSIERLRDYIKIINKI